LAQRGSGRQTGHVGPLAPQGISALLAMEVEAKWQTVPAERHQELDPENGS
jgi:hypothetical protein